MTLKSEEAEHDAAVMDARGVSWDALRLRTESERLASQRLASEVRKNLAVAAKEVEDAQAECERASHRASEAVRQLDVARDVEEDACDARAR